MSSFQSEDKSVWETIKRQSKPIKKKIVSLRKESPSLKLRPRNNVEQSFLESNSERFCLEEVKKRHIRNKISPEDYLDLHGFTKQQAEQALLNFLYKNQILKKRWVCIITGKSGIMQQHVLGFLQQNAKFASGWTYAKPQDGARGALYVRVRATKQ